MKILREYQRNAEAKMLGSVMEITQEPILACDCAKQAMQQGWEEGRQQGILTAKEEYLQKMQQWLLAIPEQIEALKQDLRPQVIDIVAAILPQFFLHHALIKENIEHAIEQVLDNQEPDSTLRVLLSQEDYQLLQQQKIDLPQRPGIAYCPSAKVQLGGCLIESDLGQVDGRLEQQIDKMKELLWSYKRKISDARME